MGHSPTNLTGKMEFNSTRNDENFCRKWRSSVKLLKPIFQRCFEERKYPSVFYNADPKTADLLLKTMITVNQLSIF